MPVRNGSYRHLTVLFFFKFKVTVVRWTVGSAAGPGMIFIFIRVIQLWANRILTEEDTAGSMTEQVMNGTIRLLHQGGDTADLMSDWHPVFNQLIMHMIDNRLRGIVEMEGFLSPGQGGGRQGRSVTINTSKLEWVTERAQRKFKSLYKIDVNFRNAFNVMNPAGLWP